MNKISTYNDPFDVFDRLLNNRVSLVYTRDYFTEDKDNKLILEVPIPGFKKDDISIEISDGLLKIEGKDTDSHWTESFTKNFKIPNRLDPESIKAEVKDGILKISFERDKASLPKTIKVT
jgi:HSP20 family protein